MIKNSKLKIQIKVMSNIPSFLFFLFSITISFSQINNFKSIELNNKVISTCLKNTSSNFSILKRKQLYD